MVSNESSLPLNVSRAPIALVVTSIFFFIALCAYVGRMFTRIKPVRRLGWDDYILSVAVVLAIAQYGVSVLSLVRGSGKHTIYVRPQDMHVAVHLNFALQSMWMWAVTLIKSSVALMLLRVTQSRRLAIILWLFLAFLAVAIVASEAVQFAPCTPISAFWDPRPGARCWTETYTALSITITSSVFVFADFFLSLFPLTFIQKLSLPLRDKIILFCLMGLGLIATAAAIVRMILIRRYINTRDPLWEILDIGIWAWVEEYLGIIAACVPTLRAPFENMLRKWGILSTRGETAQASGLFKLSTIVSVTRKSSGDSAVVEGHQGGGLSVEHILRDRAIEDLEAGHVPNEEYEGSVVSRTARKDT